MQAQPFTLRLVAAASLSFIAQAALAQNTTEHSTTLQEVTVTATAEEAVKQQLGVSTITAEDLSKRPPANDLAELIRTQPGVNLTGNSASGQYGNSRQIDLRGMGPENTLILIDGRPVRARDGVMMGRSGERDTRGDSNWVPADSIESIEVIRGPAAARYGSGASGGVVNIITKKPSKQLKGSVTVYADRPADSKEQDTRRASFNLSGPLGEDLSFRLLGNIARTSADAPDINAAASGIDLSTTTIPPAGREGVRNRDLSALVRWNVNAAHTLEVEAGVSRQGNIYAGERRHSGDGGQQGAAMSTLAREGAETNSTIRRTASLTHRGRFDFGSTRSFVQIENVDRRYMPIGLAGGPEGNITSATAAKVKSKLKNLTFQSELNAAHKTFGIAQMLTAGVEIRRQHLDDPFAMSQSANSHPAGSVPGLPSGPRSGVYRQSTSAVFVENNMDVSENLLLTPALRLDHGDFGNNWSPSLNAVYQLTPELSLKGGIARAFKSPNLYQSNPNYLWWTMGQGCPAHLGFTNLGAGCYIQGNANLQAETSVNKEIGIAFDNQRGLDASITLFQNDYKNKIHADLGGLDAPITHGRARTFKWANASTAVVRGVEGSLNIPLVGERGQTLKLFNNFTWMGKNHNKSTGQPLSVIPKYTVNSTLDWQVSPAVAAQFTATFYGKQIPRSVQNATAITGAGLDVRGAYHLLGASVRWDVHKNLRVGFGIENLANKKLYRHATQGTGAGAATYNEPGRSYYLNATASF